MIGVPAPLNWSPVESERLWQREQLNKLFPHLAPHDRLTRLIHASLDKIPRAQCPSMAEIEIVVCPYFNCTPTLSHSRSRKQEAVDVRQVTMTIRSIISDDNDVTIGSFYRKDSATVKHSKGVFFNMMSCNKAYREKVMSVARDLGIEL